jgi:DNA-binding GntR family transcriptional regulator
MTELAGTPSTKIAAEIRRQIRSGQLAPGDRVPSTREITRRWGVAMATASKVLAALKEEGLVATRPGLGTVVAGRGSSRTRSSAGRCRGRNQVAGRRSSAMRPVNCGRSSGDTSGSHRRTR